MLLKILKYLSPFLKHILNHKRLGLRYYLYQTTFFSDYHIKIFLFTNKYLFLTDKDLKNMLNIVLNLLEDYYLKYNYNFEITFYYANKEGTMLNLSQPFIFYLHSQLDLDGVYEAIKWNKFEKLNNDIIIIVNIL